MIPLLLGAGGDSSLQRKIAYLFLPCCTVIALLFGPIVLLAGVTPLWDQTVVGVLTVLPGARRLPSPFSFSPTISLQEYFSFFVSLVIVAATLVRSWYTRKVAALETEDGIVSLLTFTSCLIAQALMRFDMAHCLPLLMFSLLLLGITVGAELKKDPSKKALAFVVYYLVAGIAYFTSGTLLSIPRLHSPFDCHSSIPLADCTFLQADQQQALRYIRSHTSPHEPVYVGAVDHDKLVTSDVSFYFFADRPVPTFHSELHPGFSTTQSGQRRIIRDLEQHQVQWVVTFAAPHPQDPNLSSVDAGVYELDSYLEESFEEVARFDRYVIRRRKHV